VQNLVKRLKSIAIQAVYTSPLERAVDIEFRELDVYPVARLGRKFQPAADLEIR
jgi:hypothetical protein